MIRAKRDAGRRRRVLRGVLFLAVVAAPVSMACSALLGIDVPPVLEAPISDGAVGGEGPRDGGSSADVAPPFASRLENGDFEAPGGGCGPGWMAYGGATFERATTALSGSSACKVCNVTSGGTRGIHTFLRADGGATRATAWFRSAPDGGNVATAWIFLYALYADGGGNPTPRAGQSPVGDEWRSVTAQYPPSGEVTELRLHVETGEPGCLLFDDVTVEPP